MGQVTADEVAYHEAGHATIACVLGARVKLVTLSYPNGKYVLDGHPPRPTCALIAAAGPMAQLKLRGYGEEERAALWESGWRGDVANMLRLHDGLFAPLLCEARRLVRQNWRSIERVAAALVERKSLSGAEIEALVRGG